MYNVFLFQKVMVTKYSFKRIKLLLYAVEKGDKKLRPRGKTDHIFVGNRELNMYKGSVIGNCSRTK